MQSFKDLRILFVEDEKIVREKITSIFSNIFSSVEVAGNGEIALTKYLQEKPNKPFDLIISDINMPIMNGIELLKKLRNINDNIPIIFVTARSESNHLIEAINLNASNYIIKPLILDDLMNKIKNIFNEILIKKELNAKVQELNEYQRVLNESDIISKCDTNGLITFVNNNFCETSGYSEAELIGKHHRIVRHPDNSKLLYNRLCRTLKSKKTFKEIIKNKKKNGDSYYVDATISPILDLNGEIQEYLAIRHDVSEMIKPKDLLLDKVYEFKTPTLILAQIINYDIIKEYYTNDIQLDFEKEFSKYALKIFRFREYI